MKENERVTHTGEEREVERKNKRVRVTQKGKERSRVTQTGRKREI